MGTTGHADLVARVRSFDPDAWEELYRAAHPTLVAYARHQLGSPERAEDAVSETMTRAMSAIDRYRHGDVGLQGWLVGILRNVVHEAHRQGSRSVPAGAATDTVDLTTPDPVDGLVAGEEAVALRRAFARLSSEDRELLGLRVVARLDAEAVGAILGKRAGAVRMAQARALTRLRAMLEEVDR